MNTIALLITLTTLKESCKITYPVVIVRSREVFELLGGAGDRAHFRIDRGHRVTRDHSVLGGVAALHIAIRTRHEVTWEQAQRDASVYMGHAGWPGSHKDHDCQGGLEAST